MKCKKSFILFILLIIFLYQFNLMYKKSFSNYVLDINHKTEKNDIDYVILSYNLMFINDILNIDKDDIVSLFFVNDDEKYNICLQYYINQYILYPAYLPKDHKCNPLTKYNSETLKNSLSINKNNYVVIVGKDYSIGEIFTNNDINIYKYSDNSFEYITSYDNTIYNIKKMAEKYDKNNYLEETLKYVNNYLDDYSYFYGYSIYKYIYDYANSLSLDGQYDYANYYYSKYLELPLFDSNIVLNKAIIYHYKADLENAKLMIDNCLTRNDCDINKAYEFKNEWGLQ